MFSFDYIGRTKRFQEMLAGMGAAGGIIMKAANVRYLTGFWGYATRAEYSEPRRLICLVVPQNGRPLLIVPKIEHEFAFAATRGVPIEVQQHVEWKEDGETEDAWGIARIFLRDNGVRSGTIAFERQHMTARAIAALEQALNPYDLIDGSGWIEGMRAIKDDLEIELLTRCGRLADEQYSLQVNALRQNQKRWREYELAMLGWQHVVRCCAAELEHNDVVSPIGEGVQLITSGPRLARAHGSASCRQIEKDDVVMMDYCRVSYLLGYRIGMGRVVSLRKLTSEEEDIEAAVAKAYEKGISMLRPGASCSDIDGAIRRVLVDAGLAPFIVHRSGRGVGVEAVELPEIKEGVPDVIQAGMVVSIEPSIYKSGFASRIENTLLITEDGPQLLTRTPIGIRILAENKAAS